MGRIGSMLYDTSRRVSKKVSNLRRKNPKRLPWRDKPDAIFGRYFFWTIPYGLFYIIGAIVGYSRTGNWFCLGISGGCGLILIILGAAHSIDYYRGANLEAIYLAIPFVISLFVSIFMTCVYGMGATLKIALPVAIIAWFSVVFYMYAIAKEHGGGEYQRENIYVKTPGDYSSESNISDIHDLVNATEEEREQFRKTVAQNLASAFNMPNLAKGFNKNHPSDVELRRREGQKLLDKDQN